MRPLPLLLLLAACNPFDRWPDGGYTDLVTDPWDPNNVVATADGSLYLMLPGAGALLYINPKGEHRTVDLDGAKPTSLTVTPDGEQVLVFAEWPRCENTDSKIETVEDCEAENLDDLSWVRELEIVKDGKLERALPIAPHLNTVSFTPDGTSAVAWLDYQGNTVEIEGIADLTEVVFINLSSGDTQSISIGSTPNQILFTPGNERAIVLSRSTVVVADLEANEIIVEYPLALDADAEVYPEDAVITPDGEWLLLSVRDSAELYELNLSQYFIDIEDLPQVPSDLALAVDESLGIDETLILYSGSNSVDVLDHATYDLVEAIPLDEPVTEAVMGEGFALLYNTSSVHTDVYRLSLDTREVTEYVMENPIDHMDISPSGTYGVGVLRPNSEGQAGVEGVQDTLWGLGVVELLDDDAVSLVLESEPVGLELVTRDGVDFALVLMAETNTLLTVDLSQPSEATVLDLSAPPIAIGALEDGRFFITHDEAFGLISLLDPATGKLSEISGFAVAGLLPEETLLPRRADD